MMWNTEEISSQIKKQIETYTSQIETLNHIKEDFARRRVHK